MGKTIGNSEIRSSENVGLNAVRSAAALLVVLAHVRSYLLVSWVDAPKDLVTQGLMALFSLGNGSVIVFFVLSGYFVGGSVLTGMRRGTFSWTSYAISRLTRLWIVLLPAIVLTIVLDVIGRNALGYSPRYGAGSNSENSDLWTILGNVFFLASVYVEPLGSNRALWSLTYEFAYYAIFPLLIGGVVFARRLVPRVALVVAGVALIVFYGSGVAALFPAWLLGALIAYFQVDLRKRVAMLSTATLGCLRCVAIVILLGAMLWDRISGGSPWHTPPATFAVAAVAGVLVVLLLPDLTPKRVVPRRLLQFASYLASSSFSLYAIHLPVLVFLAVLLSPGGVTGSWIPSPLVWTKYLAVVALLVGVGWAFGTLTERHTDAVRRFVSSKLTRKWSSAKPDERAHSS